MPCKCKVRNFSALCMLMSKPCSESELCLPSAPHNSRLRQACQEARGQQLLQCHDEDTMGLGELKQAPVGLMSEDEEGQAEEEQGACTAEGQS